MSDPTVDLRALVALAREHHKSMQRLGRKFGILRGIGDSILEAQQLADGLAAAAEREVDGE